MSGIEVRPFRPEDEAACRKIAARAAASSYGSRLPHTAGRLTAERPLERADARLTARDGGEVVGFLDLVGAHVSNLFVDPAWQGLGVGTALMAAAEREVAGDLTLSVFTVNPEARRLYERLGYAVEGVKTVPFAGGEAQVWAMRKRRSAPPWRLVVFDFDGVLADSAPWMIGVLNGVAERYGFRRVSDEEIEQLRRLGSREIVKALKAPAWRLPAIARHMRALSAADAGRIPLFPGAAALLARLQAAGVKVAIVSSNAEATVRAVLGAEAARVDRYDCGAGLFGKAAKLKRTVRALEVDPAAVLCVGDETRDVEAARKAGLTAAAASWGYARAEALASAKPDLTFASLAELEDALLPPSWGKDGARAPEPGRAKVRAGE